MCSSGVLVERVKNVKNRLNGTELVEKVGPYLCWSVYPKGIPLCSNTQKQGYGVGGIEPVRIVVLRIPIQYLLMGTSKVLKKNRDQCPGSGVIERNPTGNTIRE